ncbi:MAG TPA: hypothetical protein VJB38_02210, partial [Bacteroidota bacterium]|nr:hypothetical protein [Bacteroidota bacterium]
GPAPPVPIVIDRDALDGVRQLLARYALWRFWRKRRGSGGLPAGACFQMRRQDEFANPANPFIPSDL